uniref:Uncharacterized protein n=1 Tax=Helobdella robusta TaxID=6412 RepID=T1FL61_HELRO
MSSKCIGQEDMKKPCRQQLFAPVTQTRHYSSPVIINSLIQHNNCNIVDNNSCNFNNINSFLYYLHGNKPYNNDYTDKNFDTFSIRSANSSYSSSSSSSSSSRKSCSSSCSSGESSKKSVECVHNNDHRYFKNISNKKERAKKKSKKYDKNVKVEMMKNRHSSFQNILSVLKVKKLSLPTTSATKITSTMSSQQIFHKNVEELSIQNQTTKKNSVEHEEEQSQTRSRSFSHEIKTIPTSLNKSERRRSEMVIPKNCILNTIKHTYSNFNENLFDAFSHNNSKNDFNMKSEFYQKNNVLKMSSKTTAPASASTTNNALSKFSKKSSSTFLTKPRSTIPILIGIRYRTKRQKPFLIIIMSPSQLSTHTVC